MSGNIRFNNLTIIAQPPYTLIGVHATIKSIMMEPLIEFITHLGIFAVIAVIFAESGLFFGFFLPGDSLLFVSGALVQQGTLPINIHLFVLLLFIAAVLGDNVGYSFGHKVGRKLFDKPNSKIFKKKYLIQAEAFFEKHGPLAIVLARFVPIVRTFTPIIAGVSKMKYKTFFMFNIVGGFLWVTIFTYLGYFVGQILQELGFNIEIIALLIVFISVLPIVIHAINTKEKRTALVNMAKLQWNTMRKNKNQKKVSDSKDN